MAEFKLDSASAKAHYFAGVNEKGDNIVKVKSYRNIHPEVSADQLAKGLSALSMLTQFDLENIEKVETSSITQN